MIGARDREYIESRLLAPSVDASEAAARLRQIGRVDLADRLIEAQKRFIDECRTIRHEFMERGHGAYNDSDS